MRSESSKQLADQPVTPHDIFLSHSGAQKGFVQDLYDELTHLGFNTFFDLTHHSLPIAESFPKHIFNAANNCKLAVLILSEKFVTSRWPMLELSAFVQAGVDILPLFFKLSVNDLKNDINLNRWQTVWESFSAQDKRINPTEWRNAIKALSPINGLTFKGEAVEGEKTYLGRVVSAICGKVPMPNKHGGSHKPGVNRLRQVILDRFENMESPGKVSVLGLYGLPGSGKTTLCNCLHDHFFQIYEGRSLHLELSTKPSTTNLVDTFKKLLGLTDFNNRFGTSEISLDQVFNLLDTYQLPRCRVFVVIDNISDDDESWDALQMFLRLGVGPGSKVILVARTFQILQPAFHLLEELYAEQRHYIWEIPSIHETEAIQILLQTSGHAVQHTNYLTPSQRKIIVDIVRMCSFGPEYNPVYLPLVMKMMGAMLIKYDGNLVQWGNDMNFWGRVKTYKKRTLKEFVEKSFEGLPDEDHRLLFLDLSLFILPLDLDSVEEVYGLLSSIYDGRSVADVEMMMKDLERHCFLTFCKYGAGSNIRVHDVYLEFAQSISEDPSRFNSSMRYYCWRNDKCTAAKDCKVLSLREQGSGVKHEQVRTMILEVQGDGCERVELQGSSSLKALAVRNCKSLEVLGLEGVSSLAILYILNCPNFRYADGACKVTKLKVCSGQPAGADKGGNTSFLHALWGSWGPGEALLDLARNFKWPQTRRRSSLDMGFANKMTGLQHLTLENTGIRRLIMDMPGSCWPQLQNLTVKEKNLEAFQVGNLPNLKRFCFSDSTTYNYPYSQTYRGTKLCLDFYTDAYRTRVWDSKKDNPRFMLQGKGLLEGCPQLEQVEIQSAFFEKGELGTLPPNMVSFHLVSFYPARMLPDLAPSAHTLEEVMLQWCEKLEKISFLNVEFGKLTRVEVAQCHSLVELTGLGFLFSLRFFFVMNCSKLRTILGPFDKLKMLESFIVEGGGCPKVTGLAGADFENLVSLRRLEFPLKRAQRFNLKNLRNLQRLTVTSWRENIIDDDQSDCSTSTMQQLGGMLEGLEDLVNLCEIELHAGEHILHAPSKPALSLSFSSLVGLDQHHAQTLGLQPSTSCFSGAECLRFISLYNLRDLASMDGLDQLKCLNILSLNNLENLRSLQGLESLVHLESLYLRYCPMLEELPSLHTLVELKYVKIDHCSKLKSVEGIDVVLRHGYFPEVELS